MDKAYNQGTEKEIYKLWEASGALSPKVDKKKKPFTIIMPPPNANDPLHVGHARFVAIQDILVRYNRMKGHPTLWLPGSDHAGIETQFVFEKKLTKEGKSRFDFDRETLYKMIWDYVSANTQTMHDQLKSLGASCDWSRHKFTLDTDIVAIVNETFKKLYDDGLIYRGERIVNYCPRCGTAYSQLEVDYIERDDILYHLNYGALTIATTRPETIFADVAIAVHPKDDRYKALVGKTATIPLINRQIPIIADSAVEKEFGTGALKVTPGHDATDFEIGQRHKLQTISVIDETGRMANTPAQYTGMKAEKAREVVVADLQNAGLITKTETLHHTVGVCYRCKHIIEPMLSKQWFLTVKPLAASALDALKKDTVAFTAKQYDKMARHWLKNLRDWNISRQIVWGIQIPAWRCQKCLEWTITDGSEPKDCAQCHHNKLVRDTDTFDTWFSSAQWPFATLMANKKDDFDYFYPTSVMETAYEIIPFWVIRMIMLGIYKTGKVPFETVLIHGLVRDNEGQKISKSKGNVIDPLVMIEKYGSDPLRMGLIWGGLIENDITLSEEKIRGQRNFANKIWNIARFVLSQEAKKQDKKPKAAHADDKWILSELKSATNKITKSLDKYRLNEAAEELYEFIWHRFADVYIEKTKTRREEAQPILIYVLQESLKLAHPFLPFVTETIWQHGKESFDSPLLLTASWPK